MKPELNTEQVSRQQTINIADFSLIVACTTNGMRYLSISAICKELKIDRPTQLQRIRNTPELEEQLRHLTFRFSSGGAQPVYCLPIEFIRSWLEKMKPGIVKSPYQQRLVAIFRDLQSTVDKACPVPQFTANPLQANWEWPDNLSETVINGSSRIVQPDGEEGDTSLAAQIVLHAQLPPTQGKPSFIIPLYVHAGHTAFREASVANSVRWIKGADSEEDPSFHSSSTQLQVYVSKPSQPIGLEAAMKRIAQLGPSTVLAARLAYAMWNTRRNLPPYAESGWVAIDVEEFLLLRNLQSHSRVVSSDSEIRTSDRYFERKYIDRLQNDLELLNGCHIRKWVTSDNYYDSPYLRVNMLMESNKTRGRGKEKDRLIRVAVSPGEWMPSNYPQVFDRLIGIDNRMVQMSLKTDIHAIVIGFYLTERWRQQALQAEMSKQINRETGLSIQKDSDALAPFREPIRMRDLLQASMIEIDEINLTSRFVPRIEEALQKLYRSDILAEPFRLSPIDKTHNWGESWLNASVLLLPKLDTEEEMFQRIRSMEEFYQLPLFKDIAEKRFPVQPKRRSISPPHSH